VPTKELGGNVVEGFVADLRNNLAVKSTASGQVKLE
jgi:hypothetical protein